MMCQELLGPERRAVAPACDLWPCHGAADEPASMCPSPPWNSSGCGYRSRDLDRVIDVGSWHSPSTSTQPCLLPCSAASSRSACHALGLAQGHCMLVVSHQGDCRLPWRVGRAHDLSGAWASVDMMQVPDTKSDSGDTKTQRRVELGSLAKTSAREHLVCRPRRACRPHLALERSRGSRDVHVVAAELCAVPRYMRTTALL